jgi:hypothetical protein
LSKEDIGEIMEIMDAKLNPMNLALKLIVQSVLDPWENIRSIATEAILQASAANIDSVCEFYGVAKKHYCMVLGKATHCDIICAHIWPSHTNGKGLEGFGLEAEEVHHPRNFLRLQKDIERAFDHKRLYFEYVDGAESNRIRLRVVLLDPEIGKKNISFNGKSIPFCDVHDTIFDHTFVNDKKPFLRLISLHADQAVLKAKGMNWISDNSDTISKRARILDLARLSLEPNHRTVLDAFFQKPT